ncbi:MAG: DNA-3-methyladenine glycosylase, partial [Deltaproteobacteria bacterium]|nr:DNA-3-methyladenine glycosylase [Kofleriaceae bacterium]
MRGERTMSFARTRMAPGVSYVYLCYGVHEMFNIVA